MLKRHLAQAEKHVATGYKNIARQWELIAKHQHPKLARLFASVMRGGVLAWLIWRVI